MKEPTGVVLIGVFVAVEGAHAFSAFMPSYFTVSKFAKGEVDRQRLREGYGPAVAFNLALGGVVSAIVHDMRPLLFSVVVSLLMVGMYERAIQKTEAE
jgi:hypothetical protein